MAARITDGLLCRVRKRSWLRFGGKRYESGDVLRLPKDKAERLARPPDGSRPTVVILADDDKAFEAGGEEQ